MLAGLSGCGTATKSQVTAGSTTTTTTVAAGTTTTSAPPASTPGVITIHNFQYQPSPAHAKAGQTITVTNEDGTNHSLTADNGSFTTGVFSTGTRTFVIDKPGTYTFHCQIHNFMTGTIIVSS